MRWREICVVIMIMISSRSFGQDISNILHMAGVESPEQMDPEEYERLGKFLSNPLKINMENLEVIRASGLFTPFQTATIIDYRTRHGDILSWTELSNLEGFNENSVDVLKAFISLESREIPGKRHYKDRCRHDMSIRTGYRHKDSHEIQYGMKYSLEYGARLKINAGFSSPYSSLYIPENYSLSCSYALPKVPVRFLAGDFNARFGQGLVLWNGMSMGGLVASSSFIKRSSFISQPSTYTGSTAFTGFAASYSPGRFNSSIALAAPGIKTASPSLMPIANITWLGRYGHVSLTGYWSAELLGVGSAQQQDAKTSIDIGLCIKGTDVFGEAAYDWYNRCLAALAGTVFPAGENATIAAVVRHYPTSYLPSYSGAMRSTSRCTDESAITVGTSYRYNSFSQMICADAAWFPQSRSKEEESSYQVKLSGEWKLSLRDDFSVALRLTERIRSWGERFRTDLRADMGWKGERFLANARVNALFCKNAGLLGYLEGGYSSRLFNLYLRQGFFLIDNWDDRIYAYERDAPGSFNVPAYYGRGVWTAFTGRASFARFFKAYFRVSYIAYPFMPQEKRKPGKAELKLTVSFSL